MTATIVLSTGWTWEYVWETMTLQRLDAMNRVWKRCPPPEVSLTKLSMMVGAWMGIKDERSPTAQKPIPDLMNASDFEE